MQNAELEVLKDATERLVYENQEVKIATQEQLTQAGDMLKMVQQRIKKITDKRLEYTRPLDESKRLIMADFKAIIEPLEWLATSIKGAMVEWQQAEQQRLDDAQAELDAKALAAARENHESEVVVPVVNKMEAQRGDASTTFFRSDWKWRLSDLAKVPAAYLTVDSPKLNEAVRGGARSIPGIDIYEVKTPIVR